MLDQASNPLPLTRIWCLFEYYHSIRLNIQLQLFFPLSEAATLDVEKLAGYNVDVRSSNAKVLSDKDRILADVEATIGIDGFNEALRKLMSDCCPAVKKEAGYRQRLVDRFG